MSPEIMRRYDADLRAYRPRVLVAYASALAQFAQFLEAEGLHPTYPSAAIVTGAEKLHDVQREVIERVFRVPVHERYGSRDIGDTAFQLGDAAGGLSVDWALVLVERQTEEEPAPIIVTKLHGDAMPMFRYRVDDLARFPRDARPGYPTHTLLDVTGRSNDRISLGKGQWVHGIHFPHLFKDFPVKDFQVHQLASGEVKVRIVPTAAFRESDLVMIHRNLVTSLAPRSVGIELTDEIERNAAR